MTDAISRSEAIESLNQHSYETSRDYDNTVELLNELPTLDAVPVVHARWVAERERTGHYSHCSKCECRCQGYVPNYKYCPNCGARMDGEADG